MLRRGGPARPRSLAPLHREAFRSPAAAVDQLSRQFRSNGIVQRFARHYLGEGVSGTVLGEDDNRWLSRGHSIADVLKPAVEVFRLLEFTNAGKLLLLQLHWKFHRYSCAGNDHKYGFLQGPSSA